MTIALIVEDEPLLAAELRDQLQVLRPDVVFLDIQIPGLSGMEVAQHVGEATQIVFVPRMPSMRCRRSKRARWTTSSSR